MSIAHAPQTTATRSVERSGVAAEELLHAADAMARTGASDTTLRAAAERRCSAAADCERPGSLTVVTEDSATPLCAMHAMTAVFTTEGLLALVKPPGL